MSGKAIRSDYVEIGIKIDANPLKDLTNQINSLQKKFKGVSGDDAFGKLKDNVKKCKNPMSSLSDSFKKTKENAKKFFDSLKKIDMKSLNELDKKLTNIAKKLGTGIVSATKKATTALLRMGTVAATALGTVVYQSVSAFADREQLVGGIETLFKDSAGIVQKYANDAYKTAGLSANDYMNTVTSFSASLIQSLGGDTSKAAQYANTTITDMSDNANKMGTDIGMLQNAYGGFAKGNFTMLDNLKLGYSGTKEEMQRLLTDAEKLAGKKFNLSSYADIVEAIHVIQENMGIAGTTAKEADGTISGSLASMKSAWSNLLPAFVQGGDSLNQCIDNLIDSAKTFAGNVMPVIKSALTNILGKLGPFGESIQKIIDKITAVSQNSQKMSKIKGIFESIKTVAGTLGKIIENVVNAVVDFCTKESTLNAIKSVFDGINKAIQFCSDHSEALGATIIGLTSAFVAFKAIMIGIKVATAAYNAIQTVCNTIKGIATAAQLGFNAALLACPITWIVVAIAALIAIIVVCIVYWDEIKAAAVSCWEKIKSVWGTVCDWFNTNIVEPIKTFFSGLWDSVKNTAITAWNGICSFFSTIATWIDTNIIQPIKGFFTNLWYFIVGVAVSIWNGIVSVFSTIASWVNTNVIQPIVNFFTNLWHSIVNIVTSVWTSICTIWGQITSWININIIEPVINFFTNLWHSIVNILTSVWTSICTIWGQIASWVSANIIQPIVNFFTNLWHSIVNIVSQVWNTICSIWGQIASWVNSNIIEPIKSFFTGLWNGITDGVSSVKETIAGAFTAAYEKVVGVWEGITGFFKGIWDGIKGTVNKLINKGKEALGVESDVKGKAKKHAWGGLMTTPHYGLVAEDGAEMIIPLSKDKRARGLALWQQTGNMLGVTQSTDTRLSKYSPSNSSTGNSTTYRDGDTYSPTFNLTINSNGDERQMEYKVKKWVKEGLDDVARGLARRNPKLREV